MFFDKVTFPITGQEEVSSSSDTGSMSVSHSETSLSHPHSLKVTILCLKSEFNNFDYCY